MEWWRPDLFWPVFGALIAGGVVGYEREFRARAAGFRTHILVSISSAVLMLAAQHQVEWAGNTMPADVLRIDPVRMAHGILTGIGFLCGGVIFKAGFSIHGLTTAASLWTTSALGILFGVGFYGLAVGATLATLVVLTGFRLLDGMLPAQSLADFTFRFRREGAPTTSEIREHFCGKEISVKHLSSRLTDGGEVVEFGGTVKTHGKMDVDALTARLLADPRVVEYAIELRTN